MKKKVFRKKYNSFDEDKEIKNAVDKIWHNQTIEFLEEAKPKKKTTRKRATKKTTKKGDK